MGGGVTIRGPERGQRRGSTRYPPLLRPVYQPCPPSCTHPPRQTGVLAVPRSCFFLLLLPSLLAAAAPPRPSPTAHGDRLRDAYFRLQAKRLGDAALADVKSRADWEKKARQLRRQFLDMMGLWPLPPRTN